MSFLLSQDGTIAIRADLIKTIYVGNFPKNAEGKKQYYLAVSTARDEDDIFVGYFPTEDMAKKALKEAAKSIAEGYVITVKAEVSE